MADDWARPDERPIGRPIEVIDVPLTGPGDDPGARTDTGAPPTDWRRLLAIALVGGTVLGVGGSVLLLSADGDEPGPTDSTLSADEIAAAITTPPTLAPRDTLPTPDFVGEEVATSPDVIVPAYPEVPGVGLADLVQFDIGSAVGLLGDDVARRSETHLELGAGGYVLDITIERDPVSDRYRVVLESRGATQVAIVDVPSGITYVNPGTEDRIDVFNEEIIAGSTAADVNEFFDSLLLGPLRPDTYEAPATRGRGLVTIDGVGVAREFVTTIHGDRIPEWQIYAFSPVFEFPVEDRPSVLDYTVYVTEAGQIAQIDGVALVGDVPQLVQHRITLLDETPSIELPASTEPPVESTAPDTGSTAATAP